MSLSGVGFDIGQPGRPRSRRADGAGDRRAARRAPSLPGADAQHAGVGPRPGPGPGPPRRARRRGDGDRRAGRRGRADGLRAARPAPRLVAARPPRRAHRGGPAVGPPRPPLRQRAARADGDALRPQRPARAGSGRRAPRDARRVHGPGGRAAPPAVRDVWPLPAGLARPVGRRLRRGPPARRRGARHRAPLARRQRRDRLRRRLVPPRPRPRPAARDAARERADAGRQPAPADVADRRRARPRRDRPPRRRPGALRRPRRTGRRQHARQPDVPARRRARSPRSWR